MIFFLIFLILPWVLAGSVIGGAVVYQFFLEKEKQRELAEERRFRALCDRVEDLEDYLLPGEPETNAAPLPSHPSLLPVSDDLEDTLIQTPHLCQHLVKEVGGSLFKVCRCGHTVGPLH